ncbi:ATP-dependent nuclease [Bacillus inaquosorum]|uniref:ATP-dependent nuclease n=1 Tax=Bacillus inaquosorum TaxID=483913 RepID=UPI002282B30E|nr:AAA family ATPase [Bacillus inaquosorum]MCY8795383.1 AAA family ATPase [Bacillus inaquosorum]MCY8851956.1 AAA family ATPase [Bacillus inaquosorum]MEC0769856.1 AAA family ATPase [Bacillus inaquosorum]MEC0798476.1 AAA family ATPase [Bacillus inaquosorum]
MKIRKLTIRNYNAIRYIEMNDIPDFVVIAGPNGVGKSTIFNAIKQFQRIIKRIYISDLKHGIKRRIDFTNNNIFPFGNETQNGEIEITFQLSEKEKSFLKTDKDLITGKLDFNEINNCRFDNELGELLLEGNKFSQINHINANRNLTSKSNKEINLSSLARFYGEDDDRRYGRRNENENRFERVKDYLAAIYFDDLIKVVESGHIGNELNELVQIINSYIKPKKFLGVKRDISGLTFPIEYGELIHDIDELSSGEKEIVMLFVNLKWIQAESYIFLYDEPELHLNANLEKLLSSHLKQLQGNNQIWLATHSYEILDSANYTDVFQIVHYSGENQIFRLISNEDKFETFKSLGANVGLQLISEKVMFVEGKTDKEFFQLLFDDYKEQISFVQSTGINNLMRVSNAVVDLLTEASKASDFYLVRDKDFLITSQIEELKAKLNQKIHVLSKYHIENYFLNGEAIINVMKNVGLDKFDNSNQIEIKLKEIADSQRDDVIAQWIAFELHEELRKFNFNVGGQNLEGRLKERVAAQRERINEILGDSSIVNNLDEKKNYIKDNWENIWMDFPPGRDILKEFVNQFVEGIKYDRFIHLLVRECIKLKTTEVNNLKSIILNELGFEQ